MIVKTVKKRKYNFLVDKHTVNILRSKGQKQNLKKKLKK